MADSPDRSKVPKREDIALEDAEEGVKLDDATDEELASRLSGITLNDPDWIEGSVGDTVEDAVEVLKAGDITHESTSKTGGDDDATVEDEDMIAKDDGNVELSTLDSTYDETATGVADDPEAGSKGKRKAISAFDPTPGIDLENTPCENFEVANTKLSNVKFTDCKIHNVEFDDCKLENVAFTNCKLDGTKWYAVVLKDVNFEECRFRVTWRNVEIVDEDKFCVDYVKEPLLGLNRPAELDAFYLIEGEGDVEQLMAEDKKARVALGLEPGQKNWEDGSDVDSALVAEFDAMHPQKVPGKSQSASSKRHMDGWKVLAMRKAKNQVGTESSGKLSASEADKQDHDEMSSRSPLFETSERGAALSREHGAGLMSAEELFDDLEDENGEGFEDAAEDGGNEVPPIDDGDAGDDRDSTHLGDNAE